MVVADRALRFVQRNYRFFFLFISTSTFLCLYVFVLSWLNIAAQRGSHGGSLLRSMAGEPLSVVLIVYTFVSAWFVGGLTVFHIYLMSTNQVGWFPHLPAVRDYSEMLVDL